MKTFFSWLFLAYFFSSSAVLVLVAALVTLFALPFDRNRRAVHYFASWWGFHYVQINPFWRCRMEGREHIDPKKTYVIVANHQSLSDIMVLYGLFRPYKWVSKESILKIPFIGLNMRLNQYVTLKRGDIKSIRDMMQVCRDWLNRGASLLMFPEGTRSEDGEIHDFRDGSFRLAAECHVPVVPIVISGTREVLPKHSAKLNWKADIKVRVLPPINPDDFGGKAAPMRDYVHDLMKKTLAEMRNETKTLVAAS